MIPSTSITFNNDGTAWVVSPPAGDILALDRPCDTCLGSTPYGTIIDDVWVDHCPDCIDGRHTFEIEVETYDLKCARCGASASLTLGMTCSDHRPTMTVKTLRVSVVEGMVLQIVADIGPVLERRHIRVTGAKIAWLSEPIDGGGWKHTKITPSPDAADGKWAVKLTVAT